MARPLYISKKDMVYGTLRQRIIEGQLPPGERLVIEAIGTEFSISSIPVREVLQRLEAEGLIDFKPHIGARVSAISAENVGEVFALLESLEVISGRAACTRIQPGDINELKRLLEQMDRILTQARPTQWPERNLQFHHRICTIANYQLTDSLFERVQVRWDRIRRHFIKGTAADHLATAQLEHWQMVAALEKRDADQYETLIRRHNRAARDVYLKLISTRQP
jgi:DNA-binding GntR family transcriptional regulator